MVFGMQFLEPLARDMGVDLCGRDIGVAQQQAEGILDVLDDGQFDRVDARAKQVEEKIGNAPDAGEGLAAGKGLRIDKVDGGPLTRVESVPGDAADLTENRRGRTADRSPRQTRPDPGRAD